MLVAVRIFPAFDKRAVNPSHQPEGRQPHRPSQAQPKAAVFQAQALLSLKKSRWKRHVRMDRRASQDCNARWITHPLKLAAVHGRAGRQGGRDVHALLPFLKDFDVE